MNARYSVAERLPHLDERYGANLEPEKILAVAIAAHLGQLVATATLADDVLDWCTLGVTVRADTFGDQHIPVLRLEATGRRHHRSPDTTE